MKSCIAITGAIQGTSEERLYDELGLRSLSKRRWYSKLTIFCKIVHVLLPDYLNSSIDVFFSKQLSFKINIIQQIKIIFDVKMYTVKNKKL